MRHKEVPGFGELGAPARVWGGRKVDPINEALKIESSHFTGRRYGKSIELLEGLLKRKDLKPRQRFEALCRKAESLERLGKSRGALDILKAVTRAHPGEPLGFSLLGEYLFRVMEDSSGALGALSKALELAPDDPDSHWWRGQVFQSGLNDPKRARECYLSALRSDSKYGPAMESLAGLAESQGRWIEAVEWRKMHYLRERKAASLSAIAELYLRLGNFPASQKYSLSAVRRAPRDASVWLIRAKALSASGIAVGAIEALVRFSGLTNPKTGPLIFSRDMFWLEALLDNPKVSSIIRRFLAQ